jgi:hypothetical protein
MKVCSRGTDLSPPELADSSSSGYGVLFSIISTSSEEDDDDDDVVSSASSPPQATITRERDINAASINDRSFRLIYLFSFMNGQLPVLSFYLIVLLREIKSLSGYSSTK